MLSGYRFPIGPDGPVYSWLARWMGEVGLRDGPGAGPGVPALTLTLSGALRTGAVGGVILLHVRGATRAFRGGRRLVDTAAVRMALAAAGGAGGWLLGSALLTGGSIPGDTSQDGFFRRAGLRAFLLDRYRERLFGDLGRAVVPVAVGLGLGVAAADEPEPHGPGGRFLVAVCWTWGAVTAIGIVVLAVTGWGPPNRVLQFAFFLPLVAAIGVAVLARRGRAAAMAAVLVTGAVMVASMVGWFRQSPAVTGQEMAQVAAAGRAVSSSPADTPLVVLVDTAEPAAAYHVTRAGNVVRMGMPGERIDEMRLAVGSPDDFLAGRPTRSGDLEHDAASALYLEEARPLVDRATVLVLEPFNVKGYERALALGEEVAPGGVIRAGPGSPPPLPPPAEGVGRWALVGWSAAAVLVLAALGAGWSRWALPGSAPIAVLSAAPSVGVAVAILGAFAGDRFGLRPGGGGSLALVVAIVVAGHVAAARSGRRRHQGGLVPA